MTVLRRDAAQNRIRLLDAARIVFAEHGLDVGVEEVARVAGVGIGTLYRRFPTKDALIAELVRELLDEVRRLATAALDVPAGDGLERFLYATAEAQVSHRGCLARLWNDDETATIKADVRALMAQLLAQAQEHGRIRTDATVADLDLVFWSLRGIIEATRGRYDSAWRRQIALTLAGLRPGVPLTEPPLSGGILLAIRTAGAGG